MNLQQLIIPVLGIVLLVWIVVIVVLYFTVYLNSDILDDEREWGLGHKVLAFIPITKKTDDKKLNRIIRVHFLFLRTFYLMIILTVLIALGKFIFKL